MTAPERTSPDGAPPPGGPDPIEGAHTPTYQGSRFPWWLALVWLAFLGFGLFYLARHYLPDLRAWLVR